MPAGIMGIGFSYGGVTRYRTDIQKEKPIPPCAIVGQHDIPYTISHKSFRKELLIIFKPSGLYQIMRDNLSGIRNELLDASLLRLPGAADIPEQLATARGSRERVAIVESWLLKRLEATYINTALTDYVLGEIIAKKGTTSIATIAGRLHINRRYIERCFTEQLGITPKKFAEITRFNYLNQLFLSNSSISMQELVFMGDFHDQSHLIKHIEKMTGIRPGEYKEFLRSSDITRFAHLHNVARTGEAVEMDITESARF